MSGTPQKPKKQRIKPSKSRPVATSAISQAAVEDAWLSIVLASFSPDAQLFAFLSLAVDKHRLRVFDTNTNQSIVELIVDRARVVSLAWVPYGGGVEGPVTDDGNAPSKKRKTLSITRSADFPIDELVIALGLSDGSVQIFSASRGRILKTLTHASSRSSVLAIAEGNPHDSGDRCIWTSSSDGNLRLWDLRNSEVLVSVHAGGDTPYSAIALRPGFNTLQTHILAAHNTIQLLSCSMDSASSDNSAPDELAQLCSFGSHASLVKSLMWESSSSPTRRFYSCAKEDRFIYLWETPEPMSSKGNLIASCPLDAEVLQMDLSSSSGGQILLALSTSGKVILSPIPADFESSTTAKDTKKRQVPTLFPRATVKLSKNVSSDLRIAAATFLHKNPGKIRVALMSGGARIVFETLDYLDSNGDFISELNLKPSASAFGLARDANDSITVNKRYIEPSSITVTGGDTPHDPSLGFMADREVEGALDADLAELSLGQRLAARSDAVGSGRTEYGQRLLGQDTDGDHAHGVLEAEQRRAQRVQIPAHSLTRTLIQALHASDTSLLEACLTHSDENLVRNTVARLPSQLAIPLLTACVERLGRGARGNNIKGRGGGASAQRGMALIKWVRAVLVIHSGHLMTIPNLVARLSHLHSTLSSRLTLQDRLSSLSGRLDLVLAQVELRSSNTPAPLASRKQKSKRRVKTSKEPVKYIEGESSEEESAEDAKMQVDVEEDDEDTVEEVELDEDGDEESEEDEGSSEDEDEEDDDADLMHGFVDDEADEAYDEDEWDENSD